MSSPTPVDSHLRYPYLIIRVFAAFYQLEHIAIRFGPPAVDIANRHCFVQHPVPFKAKGILSSACRALLIAGVQDAVRRLPFRMCIVWAAESCTYVEPDSIDGSTHPPSGGFQPLELDFKAQHYRPVGGGFVGPSVEPTP